MVAKGESGMDELKQFVNDKVFCRQKGEPANFGDGNHYTCLEGGKEREGEKPRETSFTKAKKTKRRSKMGGKSKRKGKKSRKSKKSRK